MQRHQNSTHAQQVTNVVLSLACKVRAGIESKEGIEPTWRISGSLLIWLQHAPGSIAQVCLLPLAVICRQQQVAHMHVMICNALAVHVCKACSQSLPSHYQLLGRGSACMHSLTQSCCSHGPGICRLVCVTCVGPGASCCGAARNCM